MSVDYIFDTYQGVILVSNINLRYDQHQQFIWEADILQTRFKTRYRHYEFLVISFSFTNTPPTFMDLITCVFKPYHDMFIFEFIDGIKVYSQSMTYY